MPGSGRSEWRESTIVMPAVNARLGLWLRLVKQGGENRADWHRDVSVSGPVG